MRNGLPGESFRLPNAYIRNERSVFQQKDKDEAKERFVSWRTGFEKM